MGAAGAARALAGLHDQLRLGRRADGRHPPAHPGEPSVPSIPAIRAGMPGPRQHLLRYGSSLDTATLLRQFLGRPVSPDASSASCNASTQPTGSLASTSSNDCGQQLHRLVDVRFVITSGGMKRTVLWPQDSRIKSVVIGARDQRIAEFLRRLLAGAIGDQFHADHQALAANLADHRVFRGEAVQLAA